MSDNNVTAGEQLSRAFSKTLPGGGTREQRMKNNIHHAANNIIGGMENTLQDLSPDDPEYKAAKAALQDRDQLVCDIYLAATTELYEEGINVFGPQCEAVLRDLNFLGKERIMKLVEAEVDEQIRNGIEIPEE